MLCATSSLRSSTWLSASLVLRCTKNNATATTGTTTTTAAGVSVNPSINEGAAEGVQSNTNINAKATPASSSTDHPSTTTNTNTAASTPTSRAPPVVHRTLPKGTMTRKEWEDRQRRFKETSHPAAATATTTGGGDEESKTGTVPATAAGLDPLENFQRARQAKDTCRDEAVKETVKVWEERRRVARQELLKELEGSEDGGGRSQGYTHVTLADVLTKRKHEWKDGSNTNEETSAATDEVGGTDGSGASPTSAKSSSGPSSSSTLNNNKPSHRLLEHQRRMRTQPLYRAGFNAVASFDRWLAGSENGRLIRSYIVWAADGGGTEKATLASLQSGGRAAVEDGTRLDKVAGGVFFFLFFLVLVPMFLEPFSAGALSFLWIVPVKRVERNAENGEERLVSTRMIGGESFETFQVRKRFEMLCRSRLVKERLLITLQRQQQQQAGSGSSVDESVASSTDREDTWLANAPSSSSEEEVNSPTSLSGDNGRAQLLAQFNGDASKAILYLQTEIVQMKAEEDRLRKLCEVDWYIPGVSGILEAMRVYATRARYVGTLDRFTDSSFDESQRNVASERDALSKVGFGNVVTGAFSRESARH